ncbi:MAG: metallophosphoesterase family protein [Methanolinea sp.]|nr:metallophosphoesterase family protein [Methanolinea sp.]
MEPRASTRWSGAGGLLAAGMRAAFGTLKDTISRLGIPALHALFSPLGGEKRRIFLVADLHFNHARIIGYCRRPYRSVSEMNRDLVRRWNAVVGPGDTVYCLGDFCMRGDPLRFIRALNGRKVFIRGNHDTPLLKARHHSVLSYGGIDFYLVHDPATVPASWNGWVIHGHTHNNRMDTYPFINGVTRTINVSCECTGFSPVSLDYLLSLDLLSVERMETILDSPTRRRVAGRPSRTVPAAAP